MGTAHRPQGAEGCCVAVPWRGPMQGSWAATAVPLPAHAAACRAAGRACSNIVGRALSNPGASGLYAGPCAGLLPQQANPARQHQPRPDPSGSGRQCAAAGGPTPSLLLAPCRVSPASPAAGLGYLTLDSAHLACVLDPRAAPTPTPRRIQASEAHTLTSPCAAGMRVGALRRHTRRAALRPTATRGLPAAQPHG